MIILIWIQTGFAMVILSAASRCAGRNPGGGKDRWSKRDPGFSKIMVPQIMGTILVVWTTITIIVLKIFDIVLAMTNGQWGTEVLANMMFDWMFRGEGIQDGEAPSPSSS